MEQERLGTVGPGERAPGTALSFDFLFPAHAQPLSGDGSLAAVSLPNEGGSASVVLLNTFEANETFFLSGRAATGDVSPVVSGAKVWPVIAS